MLNAHALDFAHCDGIVAAIVEAGSLGVGMSRHTLRDFELTAVGEIVGDAGGPKSVTTNCRFELRIGGATAGRSDNLPVLPMAARKGDPLRSSQRLQTLLHRGLGQLRPLRLRRPPPFDMGCDVQRLHAGQFDQGHSLAPRQNRHAAL
jgi:hypothetical protein